MKVLLDENLPVDLRGMLPGHEVFTVTYLKWKSVVNGELIRRAAAHGFDVLVTKDSGIQTQQNLDSLPLAIVYLSAKSNDLEDIEPLVPELRVVLGAPLGRVFVSIPRSNDAKA